MFTKDLQLTKVVNNIYVIKYTLLPFSLLWSVILLLMNIKIRCVSICFEFYFLSEIFFN